jgi:hypothetical protein
MGDETKKLSDYFVQTMFEHQQSPILAIVDAQTCFFNAISAGDINPPHFETTPRPPHRGAAPRARRPQVALALLPLLVDSSPH